MTAMAAGDRVGSTLSSVAWFGVVFADFAAFRLHLSTAGLVVLLAALALLGGGPALRLLRSAAARVPLR